MGLFQSQISYGILLWGNATDWIKIFRMQKRAIRAITRTPYTETCRHIFKNLNILTLPSLFIYHCLYYIKTNEQNFSKQNTLHLYDTRNRNDLIIPQHRLTLTHKSFINLSVKLFNKLPKQMKDLPTAKFKIETKKMLLTISAYNIQEFFNADVLSSMSV